jgi:hypothetical protein
MNKNKEYIIKIISKLNSSDHKLIIVNLILKVFNLNLNNLFLANMIHFKA